MDATDIVLRDLADEHLALAALIAELSEPQWRLKTPADGWDIADSVSHLYFFDIRSALAMTDAAGFAADGQEMMKSFTSGGDPSVAFGRSVSGAELASEWKKFSAALVLAGRNADRTQRVPWYGPSMSVASFLTARLMETWAHSVDISDALSLPPTTSMRLKHIAHIGVLARANSYRAHQREVPEANIFVSLQAPDGSVWEWGNADAPESVRGLALDFSLLVTQRRHVQDTRLVAQGTLATEWLGIAQAFAGPAGAGRQPLS
jgi:uncharacterized protein (TIGR03084 family)